MLLNQWILEVCVLLIVVFAIYINKKKATYILSWQLPGPIAFPIIGNTCFTFFCKSEDIFERLVNLTSKYPSPMRLWLGPKLSVIITDATQAEKVMSSMKFVTKDRHIYKYMAEFNGEGLISGSGPKWKRDRRAMSPLFVKKNMLPYFPNILQHTKKLVKILQSKVDQPTFNVEHSIHSCAADFVSETIIGVKTNAQDGEMKNFMEHLTRAYIVIYARMVKVWLQVNWIFRLTKYYSMREEAKTAIQGFFFKAIDEAKENHVRLKKTDQSYRTFLDQMLGIRDDIPNFATDEELVHHLSTLYSASEDTVTSIVSFTLVLLGMHPSVQERLIEEINNVIGQRDIEESDLDKLKYLDMVIKDVLRLFPIAPFIAREASQDFHLDKWCIPEGCTVIISIQNIHRSAKYWKKPNEFYPEHFLPEELQKRPAYAYLPFSAGPRGCLGKPYANMAMQIMLATILQRYIIEADGKLEDKALKADVSVRFKDEIYPIRIKKRSCTGL